MGNDGGSFQARSDLVKEKPKEVKLDGFMLAKFRARMCTLSKERLKKPIVMCRIGNLYNFEEVIKRLMEKNMSSAYAHIKRTKDVREVKLVPNKDESRSEFPYMCPLSSIELNGINRFVGLWNCGCVFSEKLISVSPGSLNQRCPVCEEAFTFSDLISLNATPEEAETKRAAILTEQQKKEKSVKSKKTHKNPDAEDESNKGGYQKEKEKEGAEKIVKKVKTEKQSSLITTHQQTLIEKLTSTQKESQNFSSLFHTDKEMKGKDENLFTRNVRFGIR